MTLHYHILEPTHDNRTRQLAAVAVLAAMGETTFMKIHAGYALNIGVYEDELREIIYMVTVPAGGSAEVALTVDTAVGEVDGYYSGRLTARGDGVQVTTPFGVDREVESYDVTLEHLDRAGGSPMAYFTTLYRWDEFGFVDFIGERDSVTMRVPAAEYALTSFLSTAEEGSSLLAQPRVVVDGDLTIEVAARLAGPVEDPPLRHLPSGVGRPWFCAHGRPCKRAPGDG
jgi:hypothetical protein